MDGLLPAVVTVSRRGVTALQVALPAKAHVGPIRGGLVSRFDSTIFRSKRRVAGVTAAVAAGVVAAVATPALSSGGGVATAEMAGNTHHVSYNADAKGPAAESVLAPKPAIAKLAPAQPLPTNGSERASRSSSRKSLPASGSGSDSGGSPKAIAQSMLAQRGWSGQFSCLNNLWNKESGWKVSASNPSGAYGIPQALPGSKMASAGANWRSDPATQIQWGLNYIASTYGSPCAAWSHSEADNWY